jgi:hypothetical protein
MEPPYNLINILPGTDDTVDLTIDNTASSNMNGLPPINVKSNVGNKHLNMLIKEEEKKDGGRKRMFATIKIQQKT